MLLKNADLGGGRQLLPLDASAQKKVVVMGPHAKATEVLMGNYYGIPSRRIVSPLEALQARLGSLLSNHAFAHKAIPHHRVAYSYCWRSCRSALSPELPHISLSLLHGS